MESVRQGSPLGAFIASALFQELQAIASATDGYCRQWPAGDVSCEVEEWNIHSFSNRLAVSLLDGWWMSQTAEQVVLAAEAHLKTAKFGLEDLNSHVPDRKTAGLLNVAVFGRSATFALQNLKSIVPEFDEWYKVKQTEMAADVLMTYFNGLRRKIEHEAEAPTAGAVRIRSFEPGDMGPAPPNAVAQFIGGSAHEGRSGWVLRMPDGSQQHYYVDLPNVRPMIFLEDAPGGRADAAFLAAQYLEKVEAVLAEARQKFIR